MNDLAKVAYEAFCEAMKDCYVVETFPDEPWSTLDPDMAGDTEVVNAWKAVADAVAKALKEAA